MAPPRLFRVILPVPDIEAAAAFYGAWLGMPGRRVSPGRHYFDCGGTILACFDPRADGDAFDAGPNPDHVYFAVDDLEATRARPWGERSFYARDPFDNPICFVDAHTIFTGLGSTDPDPVDPAPGS